MQLPKTLTEEKHEELDRLEYSAFERLRYLCPSRYFRYYMLFEARDNATCWLPEGYDS